MVSTMIRLMIADDHQLFADGLGEALSMLPDIRVVGVVATGQDLLEKLRSQPAEVLLVDLEMPGLDGLGALSKLPAAQRAIVVTMHDSEATRSAAQRMGARGLMSKGTPLGDLAAGIRAVNAGENLFEISPQTLDSYREPILDPGAAALTDREKEILQLLAKGISSTEDLADRLFISQKTVKNHLASIFQKLSVADRTQAAIEAIRLGIAKPK
jgi:DNA-binding NarL/FixJ family response regulator